MGRLGLVCSLRIHGQSQASFFLGKSVHARETSGPALSTCDISDRELPFEKEREGRRAQTAPLSVLSEARPLCCPPSLLCLYDPPTNDQPLRP